MHIDASTGECLVFTFKEGLLSRVAHDLKLRCDTWSMEMTEEAISASFDSAAFTCINAMKNGKENPGALSAKDKAQVIDNMRDAVLNAKTHPTIDFVSQSVRRKGNALEVTGQLTITGKTNTVAAECRKIASNWVVEVDIHQPDFGIKPYTALMGAIKVKPTIKVRLKVPVLPG